MSYLIRFFFKIFKYFIIILLVNFLWSSVALSLQFLVTNTVLSIASVLFDLALISRIIMAVTVFLFFRKIKFYNVLISLGLFPLIDLLLIYIGFLVLFYLRMYVFGNEETMRVFDETYASNDVFIADVKGLLEDNTLTHFQETLLIFLGVYTLIYFLSIIIIKRRLNNIK